MIAEKVNEKFGTKFPSEEEFQKLSESEQKKLVHAIGSMNRKPNRKERRQYEKMKRKQRGKDI